MHQGNWKCSGCGATITELPFEPRSTEGLMFEGNWTCAGCGGAINKLPFQPKDTTNLKCIDCFKSSRG